MDQGRRRDISRDQMAEVRARTSPRMSAAIPGGHTRQQPMATTAYNTAILAPGRWSAGAPRWVHAVAVLTVLAAFPLLFLGAEVTTKGAGMADQRPFVNPLRALWEIVTGQQSAG